MAAFAVGAVLSAAAVTFPLEWNSTYRTDVPYEIEISPEKLGAKCFTVFADEKPLETTVFRGKLPGTIALHFTVPAGTKRLKVSTDEDVRCPGKSTTNHQPLTTNLFSAALDNLKGWKLPKGVKAEKENGGIRFSADATAQQSAFVTYDIDVPENLKGMPVIQDADVTSHGKLVAGSSLRIEQYDAAGEKLPETLCDFRWTTHMRPPEKLVPYHDEGHIHPRAAKLRFSLALHRIETPFDEYGLPITDPTKGLPILSLSHLSVRVAEQLPFPKWKDSFFGEGVSGEPGDTSMRFGDENEKCVFYQTHSRGCWSGAYQFRDENDLYFPAGEGTVEAWFKPDWKAVERTRAKRNTKLKPIALFEAYGGYSATDWKVHVKRAVAVTYHPETKRWGLFMTDAYGHGYDKRYSKVPELKDGVWTHVALEWTPGKTADLYLNGVKVASMPIPEFRAVDLQDKEIKNICDAWATEFYLGSTSGSARHGAHPINDCPLFEGWADALRVSTGRRYGKNFTPPKRYTLDSATRALFNFDRWFDGVSGGGFGFIPACVHATEDRVEHVLKVSTDGDVRCPSKPATSHQPLTTNLQYYPKDILPGNHPTNVFDINNYPVMPTAQEYREAKVAKTKTFTMKQGETVKFTAGERAYPSFVEIVNTSATEPLRYPILIRKGGLDPRSFGDLSDTLMAQRLSDRENVNKVFQYAVNASDYFMNHQIDAAPGSDKIRPATGQAIIMLNSYCGFECGPLNNMVANMFSTVALCPAAQTGGYGHSFQEVFYDGKNHIYDLSAQKFFPAMDNETAAYLKEVGDQPGIHGRVNYSPDHFMRKGARSGGAQDPSYQEKCAIVLNPGETARISYANDGRMNNLQTYNYKGYGAMPTLPPDHYDYAKVSGVTRKGGWTLRRDRIFPHYSTAVISFDGQPTEGATFKNLGNGFTYHVTCCYPIVWGEYAATLKNGQKAKIEFSTDFGKTFREFPDGGDGVYTLEYRVKARHDYLLRVAAPLAEVARFTARTEGEVNPRTYPGWVRPGENEMTLKCEKGPAARVTFGWREPAKEIVVSPTAKTGAIPGFERELVLVDPKTPLVLDVKGASSAAKVVPFGRLSAKLAGGKLTLAYDPSKPQGIVHGDDDPETRGEFPSFAAVDIVDGKAVKTITVLVAENARLSYADDAATGKEKSFGFESLPEGEYLVFMLSRFASIKFKESSGRVSIVDPSDPKKKYVIARQNNGCQNFLKAQFGTSGGRANWKWDCANWEKEWGQPSFNGFSIRSFKFPAGTSKLDFVAEIEPNRPIETAAVLVLPLCDVDARYDLRTILFGLNCDRFHR